MSIDTYPPQSTQATVQVTANIPPVFANVTDGLMLASSQFFEGKQTQMIAYWTVPPDYAGGNLQIEWNYRATSATGVITLDYASYRVRANTALTALPTATAPASFTPADTLSHRNTFTITADLFVKGDVIRVEFSRSGAGGADTNTGIIIWEGLTVTYSAYVMGYAAYPASVNNASYEEGSFTATATGFTTVPSFTVNYVRIGRQLTMMFPDIAATSNATTFTITGATAAIVPSNLLRCSVTVQNTGTYQSGIMQFSGTTIQLLLASTALFTASGAKGLLSCAVTYMIP